MRPFAPSYLQSATLVVLLLLCQPAVSVPQFVTSSDAIYETDALGDVLETIPISLSVATDINGLPLSTAIITDPNDVLGEQTTSSAATTSAAAAVVTPPAAPVVTNALGPAPITTYTYTTVDGDGNQEVFTTIFTPTYQATVYPTSYISATIVAWSDYTKAFPVPTAGEAVAGAAARRAAFEGGSALLWGGTATIAALIGGARMVALM